MGQTFTRVQDREKRKQLEAIFYGSIAATVLNTVTSFLGATVAYYLSITDMSFWQVAFSVGLVLFSAGYGRFLRSFGYSDHPDHLGRSHMTSAVLSALAAGFGWAALFYANSQFTSCILSYTQENELYLVGSKAAAPVHNCLPAYQSFMVFPSLVILIAAPALIMVQMGTFGAHAVRSCTRAWKEASGASSSSSSSSSDKSAEGTPASIRVSGRKNSLKSSASKSSSTTNSVRTPRVEIQAASFDSVAAPELSLSSPTLRHSPRSPIRRNGY